MNVQKKRNEVLKVMQQVIDAKRPGVIWISQKSKVALEYLKFIFQPGL